MSTIGIMRKIAAAQVAVPFGWYEEDGKTRGFAYGGRVFMDDGTDRPCGNVSSNFAALYSPKGTLDPWLAAAKTVTDRKRPELITIMLMAFASPLLFLNGKNTCVFSAWGSDTGAGKSSAYRVGTAVWGHPIGTKVQVRDTPNSILSKMKTLRHLPFYWDEITDDIGRKKVKEVLHELDGGKEKDRMISGTEHQEVGMMQLMLHYASNGSLNEYLRQDNLNTVASQMRVMEWEVKRIDGGPGHMMDADAEALLTETSRNFGHMGLLYAAYLARNHAAIKVEFQNLTNSIQTLMKGGQSERYWYTGAAAMTLAAKYARILGLDVDEHAILKFMLRVYKDNQKDRDSFNQRGGTVDNSENVLVEYLRDRDSGKRMVWTDWMQTTRGRSSRVVKMLKVPDTVINYKGAIAVRFAVDNSICVIARGDFDEYLTLKKHAKTQLYKALEKTFDLETGRLALCAGWVQNPGREQCVVLHIKKNTDLWDYMTSYLDPADRDKLDAAPAQPMVKVFSDAA